MVIFFLIGQRYNLKNAAVIMLVEVYFYCTVRRSGDILITVIRIK